MWELTYVGQPHRKPEDQKRVWRMVGQSGDSRRRKRAFELLETDAQRITFIGCELKVHGDRWARNHPEPMAWLGSHGISHEEAIRRHEEWIAAQLSDGFFTPAKKSK